MKNRIYHFLLDHRIGGPQIFVETLKREVPSYKHFIVTPSKGPITDIGSINLRKFSRYLYPIEVLLNFLIYLLAFVKVNHKSIFHVHGVANLAPAMSACFLRIPIVWHIHETLEEQRLLSSITYFFVKKTRHKIIVVAEKCTRVFHLPKAIVIQNAIDFNFWERTKGSIKNEKPSENDFRYNVVTVANLNPLKGTDILIKALLEVNRPVSVVIVGAELSTHKNFALEVYELARSITSQRPDIDIFFAGQCTQKEVRKLLSSADFYVLSSHSEACPISLIEAMSMSLPVISTDVGSVTTMLPDVQRPYVCEPGSYKLLAKKINKMMQLSAEKKSMIGAENRRAVEQKFSAKELGNKVKVIYAQLSH